MSIKLNNNNKQQRLIGDDSQEQHERPSIVNLFGWRTIEERLIDHYTSLQLDKDSNAATNQRPNILFWWHRKGQNDLWHPTDRHS